MTLDPFPLNAQKITHFQKIFIHITNIIRYNTHIRHTLDFKEGLREELLFEDLCSRELGAGAAASSA